MSPSWLLSSTWKQLSFLTKRTSLSKETYSEHLDLPLFTANYMTIVYIVNCCTPPPIACTQHLESFPFSEKQMQLHINIERKIKNKKNVYPSFSWLCVSNMDVLYRKQSSFHYHKDKVRKICAEAIGIILHSPKSRLNWIGWFRLWVVEIVWDWLLQSIGWCNYKDVVDVPGDTIHISWLNCLYFELLGVDNM